MNPSLIPFVEFIFTYLIHSTVAIGLVWMIDRRDWIRSSAVREGLWSFALVAGVVTATLQTQVGVRSLSGHLGWLGASVDTSPTESEPRSVPQPSQVAEFYSIEMAETAVVVLPPERPDGGAGWLWFGAVVSFLFALVPLLTGVLGALRVRWPIDDPAMRGDLDLLCVATPSLRSVRLTHSRAIDSPVAFGFLRPEICVPSRALVELTARQKKAMLAHELSHLRRRDPIRLFVCRLLETCLFIQPLNRLARRRLFEVIESRCDAWSMEQLGEGTSLAECLTQVAGWLSERSTTPMAAMASHGSPLARRVHRLLRERETLAEEHRFQRAGVVGCLMIPLVTMVVPSIGFGESNLRLGAWGGGSTVGSGEDFDQTEGRGELEHRVVRDEGGATSLDELTNVAGWEIELLADEIAELKHRVSQAPTGHNEWKQRIELLERRVAPLKELQARLRAVTKHVVREERLSSVRTSQPN